LITFRLARLAVGIAGQYLAHEIGVEERLMDLVDGRDVQAADE
jgi:hypothetical protein